MCVRYVMEEGGWGGGGVGAGRGSIGKSYLHFKPDRDLDDVGHVGTTGKIVPFRDFVLRADT